MAARKTTKAAPKEPVTLTAKEMAAELGTDAKTFRRWLRSRSDDRAGKGGRYTFDEATADAIRTAWAERSSKGTMPELKTDA